VSSSGLSSPRRIVARRDTGMLCNTRNMCEACFLHRERHCSSERLCQSDLKSSSVLKDCGINRAQLSTVEAKVGFSETEYVHLHVRLI
jgi:hypothetical protein